ncbi:MAG: hypothetical protein Q9159_000226 [Coniocarpon cinnabarinum]
MSAHDPAACGHHSTLDRAAGKSRVPQSMRDRASSTRLNDAQHTPPPFPEPRQAPILSLMPLRHGRRLPRRAVQLQRVFATCHPPRRWLRTRWTDDGAGLAVMRRRRTGNTEKHEGLSRTRARRPDTLAARGQALPAPPGPDDTQTPQPMARSLLESPSPFSTSRRSDPRRHLRELRTGTLCQSSMDTGAIREMGSCVRPRPPWRDCSIIAPCIPAAIHRQAQIEWCGCQCLQRRGQASINPSISLHPSCRASPAAFSKGPSRAARFEVSPRRHPAQSRSSFHVNEGNLTVPDSRLLTCWALHLRQSCPAARPLQTTDHTQ